MIELHRELMFHSQQHVLPTDYAWTNSIDITLPNKAQAKALNPTYRVFHSFLHSSLVDSLYLIGYAEIRQLHELARTHLVYSSGVNWEGMQEYAKEKGVAKQLNANLYAASKFMKIPKLKEVVDKNVISAALHYYRVCAKLRYSWFNTFDSRLYRQKKRFKAKKLLTTPHKQLDA